MKTIRVLFFVLAAASASFCSAQNVSGYGSMSEPLLFLLREPAVLDDLQLSPAQRIRLVELNQSFDGMLLASRNLPGKESQAQFDQVLTATRDQVAKILNPTQQTRIQQIKYRLRGVSCVQLPAVAEQLRLSESQKEDIDQVIQDTQKIVQENTSATYQGPDAYQEAQDAIAAARKAEQEQILDLLDERQKQRLYAAVGKSFDLSQLGRVSFQAPDFANGDKWLNSPALRLEDLRGKVVALHFYAFG